MKSILSFIIVTLLIVNSFNPRKFLAQTETANTGVSIDSITNTAEFGTYNFALSNANYMKSYTMYKLKAEAFLKRYPKRSITSDMLADAYVHCLMRYDVKVPLELALAQGLLESGLGKTNRNNPYNIYRRGFYWSKSPYEGVLEYYKLLSTNYLPCRTLDQLLQNYVSCGGYRYAESPTYEKAHRKVIDKIKSIWRDNHLIR